MKIILTENIKGLGRIGEVKEVKSGYAVNFLVPRNMAILATSENLKKVESLKKAREERVIAELEKMKEVAGKLKNIRITVEAKADEKGHLYAAVTSEKISEALKNERGIEANPDFILIPGQIKNLGVSQVLFKFYDVEMPFEIEVVTAGGVRKVSR